MSDKKNPKWNLTNSDVTKLRDSRDIVISIIPAWSADNRYSGQVPMLEQLRDGLDQVATDVENYLLVEDK